MPKSPYQHLTTNGAKKPTLKKFIASKKVKKKTKGKGKA